MFPPILRHGIAHLSQRVGFSAVLLCGGLSSLGGAALAQSVEMLAACEPPRAEEYLLLVVVSTPADQDKLKQTLPPSVKAPSCNYLGSHVARMGGFRKPEDADAWASYLREVAALPAFIAQPAGAKANAVTPTTAPTVSLSPASPASPASSVSSPAQPIPPRPIPPSSPGATVAVPGSLPSAAPVAPLPPANTGALPAPPVPSSPPGIVVPASLPPAASPANANLAPSLAYVPRSLPSGYGVLVDYGNRPETAQQVQTILGRAVGLAAYGQRPYVLAQFSPDSAVAIAVLRTLTQQGFSSMIVDSNGITLLTDRIQ